MPIIQEERFTGLPKLFESVKSDIKRSERQDVHLKTVDDAKKKAITMSRDYEQFRGLVDTCHLKPIHAKEFNQPAKRPQNAVCKDKRSLGESHHSASEASSLVQVGQMQTKQDFYRGLLRATDKWSVFQSTGIDILSIIFDSGMDENVFAQLVELLGNQSSSTEACNICRMLSSKSWFSDVQKFLSTQERGVLDRMINS